MKTARTSSLRELEEARDFLLRSISDLDRERAENELNESDYRRLRDDYTGRAAEVLRRLDALEATTGEEVDETPRAPADADRAGVQVAARRARRRLWPGAAGSVVADATSAGSRRRRGFIALAIIVCFVAAAVALVVVRSTNRVPGQTSSGSVSLSDTQRLTQDLVQARELSSQGRDLDAIKLYDDVLKAEPRQPEALAYRGWLLRLTGVAGHDQTLLTQGRASVASAVAQDPSYPDARAFLGYILFQDAHDPVGAVDQFRAFLADHPQTQMVDLTRDVVAQAFAAVGQPVPAASSPPQS